MRLSNVIFEVWNLWTDQIKQSIVQSLVSDSDWRHMQCQVPDAVISKRSDRDLYIMHVFTFSSVKSLTYLAEGEK